MELFRRASKPGVDCEAVQHLSYNNEAPRREIHYRQKIWNIFYFIDFLHFCGVCRVFLYLKYILTSRYYFWGVNLHLTAK